MRHIGTYVTCHKDARKEQNIKKHLGLEHREGLEKPRRQGPSGAARDRRRLRRGQQLARGGEDGREGPRQRRCLAEVGVPGTT